MPRCCKLGSTFSTNTSPPRRCHFDRTKEQSFDAGVIDARQGQYIEDRLPTRVTALSVEYGYWTASILARARDYAHESEGARYYQRLSFG